MATAAGVSAAIGAASIGADGVAAGADGAVSPPSPAISAMTVPTATPSVPSAILILAIVPSSRASTSITALSVSISAMTSPERISSPSLTSHLANLPSVIVGESAGMVTVAVILLLLR